MCGRCGPPPSPWDVPAITQPQVNRGFFRHTQPDQGTDDTTHWGSKQERGCSLSQMLIQLVSTFLGWTQHDMTTSWTSMATHSWTAMTAHRHADIPDCQALDAFSLCNWPTAIKPNKHHESVHFYMRRNIHGGAYEDTSIKHQSSIQAQMQTDKKSFPKAFYIYGLWCSVFSLYLPPHFPPSLCAVLLLFLRCFIFPFFALAHSDAFNASRVMQVWLCVSVDRQPTLKRCKCPALWSEHGKLEMSL